MSKNKSEGRVAEVKDLLNQILIVADEDKDLFLMEVRSAVKGLLAMDDDGDGSDDFDEYDSYESSYI